MLEIVRVNTKGNTIWIVLLITRAHAAFMFQNIANNAYEPIVLQTKIYQESNINSNDNESTSGIVSSTNINIFYNCHAHVIENIDAMLWMVFNITV